MWPSKLLVWPWISVASRVSVRSLLNISLGPNVDDGTSDIIVGIETPVGQIKVDRLLDNVEVVVEITNQ